MSASDDVTALHARLVVPAHPAFLEACRGLVATMAARTDAGVDVIEDLRIAVDEAAAMLLPHADGRSPLDLGVSIDDSAVRIELAVGIDGARVRRDDGDYGWMVLDAVADDVRVVVGDDSRCTITVERRWASATEAG
jgi:serine/threonine-protein kinase RsbW